MLPIVLVVGVIGLAVVGGGGYFIASYFSAGENDTSTDKVPQIAGKKPAPLPVPPTLPATPAAESDEVPAPVDEQRLANMARMFTARLRVSTASGERIGAGFIINDEGWVATSYHLVREATEVLVQFDSHTDTGATAEGFAAIDAQHDLAVLVVRPSASFSAAKFSHDPLTIERPLFVSAIPAAGKNWLTGILSAKQLQSADLPASAMQAVRDRGLGEPLGLTWIQHDAALPAASDGAPLLDAGGRFVGLTTFLGPALAGGYAIDGRYLAALVASLPTSGDLQVQPFRQLVAKTTDVISVPIATEPSSPPPPSTSTDTVAEQLKALAELSDKCAAHRGYPASGEQYAQFQQLAEALNSSATLVEQDSIAAADRQRLQTAIDKALAAELDWSDLAKQREVGSLASAAIGLGDARGLYGFAEVVLTPDQINSGSAQAVGFELIGANELWVVPVTSGSQELTRGSRWLIYGVYQRPLSAASGRPDAPRISLVAAKYLVGFPIGEK